MGKCWCQQNSRNVSRDSFIFFRSSLSNYNCVKFHNCRICRGAGEAFCPPALHLWAALKRPILSRVKTCNIIKKRLQRRCFPVNAPKFLRKPILNNICERLLLNRIWKRCWKYECEWPKKDLAAEEVAFKFLKTFMNILWISVLNNTAIALTCSKFKKYFRFSHLFVNYCS